MTYYIRHKHIETEFQYNPNAIQTEAKSFLHHLYILGTPLPYFHITYLNEVKVTNKRRNINIYIYIYCKGKKSSRQDKRLKLHQPKGGN